MFAALNSFLTRAVSGYFLNKSLRFRSSASAFLSRTPTTTGSQQIFTWSSWVKRGKLTTTSYLFASDTAGVGITFWPFFNSSDQLSIVINGAGTYLTTNALYRDPAAWYHVVVAVDTTQGTAANRILVYVNGAQVTSFAAANYYSLSDNVRINTSAYPAAIAGVSPYFDGEMAEVNFVDGQALAPTAFGATGANSQWLPKAYTGTYGTNGFYLPFTNTTSTSTLVADSSGNANNWTPNNISLTAGSTYDSLTDVPTLTSETVANYAVMNPLQIGSYVTLSNGNLTVTGNTATDSALVLATIGKLTSGKWYWEYTQGTIGSETCGVITQNIDGLSLLSGESTTSLYGVGARASGAVYGGTVGSITSWTTGDVIGLSLDCDNGAIYWSKNGTALNGGVPTSGASKTGAVGAWTPSPTKIITPSFGAYNSGFVSATFGQRPFTYTAPTGFLPLNTYNIAAGTVTTSGTFTGNLSTDGPFVFLNGTPTAMTINGNAVTFGTHADKLANGFKVRSSSASYNASGSNTYVATTVGQVFKYEEAQANP